MPLLLISAPNLLNATKQSPRNEQSPQNKTRHASARSGLLRSGHFVSRAPCAWLFGEEMEPAAQEIKFDSGTGWAVVNLTFQPQYGITVDALFQNGAEDSIYLELRGIRSPDQLLGMLNGFDDFQILTRETGTPYPTASRFLLRFFIDDDSYETIIDEYEAYRIASTEHVEGGNASPATS